MLAVNSERETREFDIIVCIVTQLSVSMCCLNQIVEV